jgi:xanthine dehydrogenase YagS FAD-binding subunit
MAVVFKKDQVVNASVFLSGVAPIPWRSKEVEAVITGKRLDAEIITKAGEAAVQKARPMEQNAYKIPILRSIIEEQLQAIAQQS